MPTLRRQTARDAYLWACELELRALKPGNVSVHSEGHDMTVEDFRASARVSADSLADPRLSLGERIYRAIEATRAAVGCNTNLGIVLLAAPLMQAYLGADAGQPLAAAVARVLGETTVADADWAYRAIRLARPAGLGEVSEQDVAVAPSLDLRAAMRLAARRDSIARQYVESFAEVFHTAIPLYDARLSLWDDEVWATVAVYLGFLAHHPDSHIERKFGVALAAEVTERIRVVEARLAAMASPDLWTEVLREVDRDFKTRGINPGTSADLTVATLLASRLDGRDRHARVRAGERQT